MKYIFTFIIFIVFSFLGISINNTSQIASDENVVGDTVVGEKPLRTVFYRAMEFFYDGMYKDAWPYINELVEKDPDNSNFCFYAGICQVHVDTDMKKAITYLEKATQNVNVDYYNQFSERKAPVFAFYYLAKVYHFNNEFDKALDAYSRYKSYLSPQYKFLVRDVEKQIKVSTKAKETFKKPVNAQIEEFVAVGDGFSSFSANFSSGGALLYLSSQQRNEISNSKNISSCVKNDENKKGIYPVGIGIMKKEGPSWSNVICINQLNSRKNDYFSSISFDGNLMLFCSDRDGDMDIFQSNQQNGVWQPPVVIGDKINSRQNEYFAIIDALGFTMYFVSDRKGGYGGKDIYKTQKLADGSWGVPENMGNWINTEFNEESPYISKDSYTFYFSSEGHSSIGGYDVFYCKRKENGVWSRPENIGFPVNTSYNELYFNVDEKKRKAVYSANRKGSYNDYDIFVIGNYDLESMQNTKDFATEITAKVDVRDSETRLEIDDIRKEVKELREEVRALTELVHELVIKKEEAIETSSEHSLTELAKENKINIGSKIILRNIFFDTGVSELRSESTEELDKLVQLMKDNPRLKIEVMGHTDNISSEIFNQELSEKRALTVLNYLINNGIQKNMLVAKGYGSKRPISSNKTESGRQQNRRTEFVVLQK